MNVLDLNQGMPKICIPIVEKTREEILQCATMLQESVADVIEWRGDFYEDLRDIPKLQETARLLKSRLGDKTILFTIRTAAEGGEVCLSFSEYEVILRQMAGMPEIAWIDVEMFWGYRDARLAETISSKDSCHEPIRKLVQELRHYAVVIGSYHDFGKTPALEEISGRLMGIHEMGADIPKIAVMPKSREDVLTLMRATFLTKKALGSVPLITMSMGALGAISRVAGESFGSSLTFGCIEKSSAPGQIEAEKLREIMEILHLEERMENEE